MKEKEFKALLDRERNKADAGKLFSKQIELLVDLANYGSNLIIRAYDSSKKRLEDAIVIGVLLKQMVQMLDAVEVLVSHGIVRPANLQIRCAFEASLYVDFILKGDSEQKASYYYVANLRNMRKWMLRHIPGSAERQAFSHVYKYLEGYMDAPKPELVAEAKKDLEITQRMLSQDRFNEINNVFEKMRSKSAEWYKVYGVKSLWEIAKEVERLPEYEIYYRPSSEVMHSGSYRQHIQFHKGAIRFEPIRGLEGADSVLQNAICIVLATYRSILKQYRYGELDNFKRKYLKDWRDGFLNITHVTYVSDGDKE